MARRTILFQLALDSGLPLFSCFQGFGVFGRFLLYLDGSILSGWFFLLLFVGHKDGGCWSILGPLE
jgi:hypothetical protein